MHPQKGSGAGTGLSDSDKITVQVWLDVRAFGEEVSKLGLSTAQCASYSTLLAETASAERMVA